MAVDDSSETRLDCFLGRPFCNEGEDEILWLKAGALKQVHCNNGNQ